MPSATIPRAITPQEAADALREHLGGDYEVTSHGSGLTVKHGSLSFATVRLRRNGDVTTFGVHGGGLIVGRIVNEFGIARKVVTAINETFGSAPGS
jgi:hypothetical protein